MTSPLPSPRRGVSSRAVFLGALGSLAIAVGEPYGVLVLRGSPMAADFSAGAALFLFFLLSLALNPLLTLFRFARLQPGEMATCYIMMAVAAAIPSWGFTMNLIPLLGGFYYYATPENGWLTQILPHLPSWLVPNDPLSTWKLFEGGRRDEALPWAAWSRPLLAWSLFIVCLYFVTLCLLVILRKQWMEREKLLYPLAILPLELCARDGNTLLPPLLRNPLTWLGFALPALINSANALHAYFNFIPPISLATAVPILRNAVWLNFTPRFEVIGLSYLLSLDVSFGVWFFALLAHLHNGLELWLGWSIGPIQPFSDPASPSVAHLALGALFFLVASCFWNARSHLRQVGHCALGRPSALDDRDELVSYRVAVIGCVLGTVLCCVWLMAAGLNLATALVFLLSSLVIFLGLTRIISQTGLAYGRATVAAPIFTANVLGSAAVGSAGLSTLGLNFAWSADIRTLVMASAATGLKMARETGLESRRLLGAILLAICLTLAASAWTVLRLAYTYGGINLVGWQFIGLPTFAGDWITQNINNPQAPQWWHLGYSGFGAVLMGILTYVKGRYVGFPLHPIGMTLGLTHPIYHVWFSVALAWMVKALTLKYGGARVYLQLRPFFLGMTLGAFGSAGIWLVIDYLTGMSGNVFTLG
ncbi:MAG: hypothetical protein IT369_24135 [Candidatus Latescibacteria bacterium]|nr:hypothetical protein [Candidatus Latescibacterota bacterium]